MGMQYAQRDWSVANQVLASYGYGGGYSTTNYGAQGGADGGGFVPDGSQGGSQGTPGGGKVYQTLHDTCSF